MVRRNKQLTKVELDRYFSQYIESGVSIPEFCEMTGIPLAPIMERARAYRALIDEPSVSNHAKFQPISISLQESKPLATTEYELRLTNGTVLIIRGTPEHRAVKCLLEIVEG